MKAYTNQQLFESLSELKVIDDAKLNEAKSEAESKNKDLEEVLLEKDLITDVNLGKVISDIVGVPLVRLEQVSILPEVLQIIPEVVAREQKAVVFGEDEKGVKLAMVNPKNTEFIGLIGKKTGENVAVFMATPADMELALTHYKKDLQKSFNELIAEKVTDASREADNEVPATEIVNLLVEYAQDNRSSDIHIEPRKKDAAVRFRIDGVLNDVLVLPLPVFERLVTRIKVASKLRTDEHLSAQDGKMQVSVPGEDLDIRVSIVPIIHGEKVVMRLLSAKSRQFGLTDLGFSARDLEKVKAGFEKSFGMVLVTGPTGSGKTTSIYSILKILNTRDINIATIEDPVEYDIEGINQIQVNAKTNLTFASGLRSILRQDPNVIFIGEIRDEETAGIAVNAAMTGHMVLSTLHTNDAATTLPRLIDMKIEPYLVASTVNVISAQRLVRKICEKCRVSKDISLSELMEIMPKETILKHFGKTKKTFRLYKGKGCPVCHNSGYAGRIGIFEVLVITDELKELIMAREDATDIRKRAIAEGMVTMLEDGLEKVKQGLTTVEEIMRVTKD
jgi:type IV pilus assembly protein PilB